MAYFLTVETISGICYEFAKAHLTYDEPIASFEENVFDLGKLELALQAPQKEIAGNKIYRTLAEQAAVLYYELNKLHAFVNGNKRIACVALMVFLYLNGHWLQVSWRKLYDIALTVATTPTEQREGIMALLTEFIRNNIAVLDK